MSGQEADVIVTGATGASAGLVLEVVGLGHAAVALGAVARVLRKSYIVGGCHGRVLAAVERELVTHVDLVNEDRQVDVRLAVHLAALRRRNPSGNRQVPHGQG